ncbi:putative PEP-binding protein, partial [Candidatus Omnitrophota bacterium]
ILNMMGKAGEDPKDRTVKNRIENLIREQKKTAARLLYEYMSLPHIDRRMQQKGEEITSLSQFSQVYAAYEEKKLRAERRGELLEKPAQEYLETFRDFRIILLRLMLYLREEDSYLRETDTPEKRQERVEHEKSRFETVLQAIQKDQLFPPSQAAFGLIDDLSADVPLKIEREVGTFACVIVNRIIEDRERQLLEAIRSAQDDKLVQDELFDQFNDIELVSMLMLQRLERQRQPDEALRGLDIVVVAEEMEFSLLEELREQHRVVAVVTKTGTPTAHWVAQAGNDGIMVLTGAQGNFDVITGKERVYVDGYAQRVVVQPNILTRLRLSKKKFQEEAYDRIYDSRRHELARTKDGVVVKVFGSVGDAEGVKKVVERGGDGVGLWRTERTYNDLIRLDSLVEDLAAYEESLFNQFVQAANAMKGTVVLRFIDRELDKDIKNFPRTQHFGLSFYFDDEIGAQIVRAQIRAVFRAYAACERKNIEAMFPLVETQEEVDRLLALVDEVRADVVTHDIVEEEDIEKIRIHGFMIEKPLALRSNRNKYYIFHHAHSAHLGTNDLTEGIFGVSRDDEHHAYLFIELRPEILMSSVTFMRAVKQHKLDAAEFCGELAGSRTFLLFLLWNSKRLGVPIIPSIGAVSIPGYKEFIRHVDVSELDALFKGRYAIKEGQEGRIAAIKQLNRDVEAKVEEIEQRMRQAIREDPAWTQAYEEMVRRYVIYRARQIARYRFGSVVNRILGRRIMQMHTLVLLGKLFLACVIVGIGSVVLPDMVSTEISTLLGFCCAAGSSGDDSDPDGADWMMLISEASADPNGVRQRFVSLYAAAGAAQKAEAQEALIHIGLEESDVTMNEVSMRIAAEAGIAPVIERIFTKGIGGVRENELRLALIRSVGEAKAEGAMRNVAALAENRLSKITPAKARTDDELDACLTSLLRLETTSANNRAIAILRAQTEKKAIEAIVTAILATGNQEVQEVIEAHSGAKSLLGRVCRHALRPEVSRPEPKAARPQVQTSGSTVIRKPTAAPAQPQKTSAEIKKECRAAIMSLVETSPDDRPTIEAGIEKILDQPEFSGVNRGYMRTRATAALTRKFARQEPATVVEPVDAEHAEPAAAAAAEPTPAERRWRAERVRKKLYPETRKITPEKLKVVLKRLMKAEQKNPNDPDAPFRLGLMYQWMEHLPNSRAIEYFQQAIALEPNNPHFHYSVGLLHFNAHENNRAIAAFEQAIALESDYIPALQNYSVSLQRLNQNQEAREPMERALEVLERLSLVLPEKLFAMLRDLSSIYVRLRDYEKTCEVSERALAVQGVRISVQDRASVLINWSTALHNLNDSEQAIAKLDEAIQAALPEKNKPVLSMSYLFKGIMYFVRRDYSQARDEIEVALQFQDFDWTRAYLGYALFRLGETELARGMLEPARERSKGIVDLADLQAFIVTSSALALMAYGEGNFVTARTIVDEGLAVMTEDRLYWQACVLKSVSGMLLLQEGKPEQAEEVLVKAAIEILAHDRIIPEGTTFTPAELVSSIAGVQIEQVITRELMLNLADALDALAQIYKGRGEGQLVADLQTQAARLRVNPIDLFQEAYQEGCRAIEEVMEISDEARFDEKKRLLQRAVEQLTIACRTDSLSADSHMLLALAYHGLDELEPALAAFKRAQARGAEPAMEVALHILGITLILERPLDEAVAAWRGVLPFMSGDPVASGEVLNGIPMGRTAP